ncbi:MAG: hypothetical protein WB609_10360 [Candidatus Cybelea sp.]
MSIFLNHLEELFGALAAGRHFAFTRYGDGEARVLQGHHVCASYTNRAWCWWPALNYGDQLFSQELDGAFSCGRDHYYIGISCPCCGPRDHAYYTGRLDEDRVSKQVSYANLFSNGNWKALRGRLVGALIDLKGPIVLISHWDKDYEQARSVLKRASTVEVLTAGDIKYDIPLRSNPATYPKARGGAVLWYCSERDRVLKRFEDAARAVTGGVFLFQLGPVANVLIHRMFTSNSGNTYLDMGHSLDPILFADPSRSFHTQDEHSPMCIDMDAAGEFGR